MNTVLLTIDDVPSRNTPAIVDYLNSRGIRAILFATGMNVERYYDEAIYALRHGMIIGNHSYSHPGFSSLTFDQCVEEIQQCEHLLDRLYRDSETERIYRPFRFPYGDKGGKNKDALQRYFREQGFHKVDDRHIPYAWWADNDLNTDIDTLWTFDFEEYRLWQDPIFTVDSIREKMNDPNPPRGAALYGENQRHILLMHAFDETEEAMPQYYRQLIDCLLEHGVTFDEPRFL